MGDLEGEGRRLSALRQRLESGLRAIWPETIIFGEKASAGRVANTLQFAVPGIKAQTALMALDLDGIAVSSGLGLFLRNHEVLGGGAGHGL